MCKTIFFNSLFVFVFAAALISSGAAQTTERAPFALELPELNTGAIKTATSFVSRTDVNIVKFWIANPYADAIAWSDVRPIINGKAAATVCSQRAGLNAKILHCDLNRNSDFALDRARNTFEIEAKGKDGARYYASFVVTTNAKMALPSRDAGGATGGSEVLRFSGRKFAVIIGVSDYQFTDAGLGNLRYADDDAQALYQFLIEPQGGGFAPNDILYLTNEKATLSAVRDSLNRFLTKANETDLVVFFLAGHGTPDPYDPKNLYYLVYDSKVANLKQTALPMLELKQIIDNRLRAKRAVFLLDTCHSAGVSGKTIVPKEDVGTRQLVQENNFVNQFAVTQLFNQEGRAVLTSSDVNETSRESERWGGGHGVFTFALLEGFRGKADQNKDKLVTTGELFNYVQNRVRQETGQQQNPRALPGMNNALEIARVQ